MSNDGHLTAWRSYEVRLELAAFSRAKINIEAGSLAEAQAKAEALSVDDIENWEFLYDDKTVDYVAPVGEELDDKGQGDE